MKAVKYVIQTLSKLRKENWSAIPKKELELNQRKEILKN